MVNSKKPRPRNRRVVPGELVRKGTYEYTTQVGGQKATIKEDPFANLARVPGTADAVKRIEDQFGVRLLPPTWPGVHVYEPRSSGALRHVSAFFDPRAPFERVPAAAPPKRAADPFESMLDGVMDQVRFCRAVRPLWRVVLAMVLLRGCP